MHLSYYRGMPKKAQPGNAILCNVMSAKKVTVDQVRRLRVAIIATPWLSVPPRGYGGIEMVLDALIKGLVEQGVEVEVFGVGRRKLLHGAKIHPLTRTEQFEHIHDPWYKVLPIVGSHVQEALKRIEADGKFDVIHDHNGHIGPQVLSWATRLKHMPPAIHTLHGPPFSTDEGVKRGDADNRPFWDHLGDGHHMYVVGISDALIRSAPPSLKPHILGTVYNAVDVRNFPYVADKKNYFITLARFNEDKAQHIAVEYCHKLKYRLRMAGTIGDIETGRKLLLELANPMSKYRQNDEFRYYSDKILPFVVRNPRITYSGNMSGKKKLKFISEAKALLFPVQWEEPFGMAVIEALACGTPVVAMSRGALPELIEHGVNGFLADTEEEFGEYMKRVGEIDPAMCRKSVVDKFSAEKMASNYIERYKEVITKRKKS
jgi:glycosyltransferase involved in cell wall biosynthesis